MSLSTSASFAKVDLPGARMGDHLGARALDDHLAQMQHGDALGEVEGHVHVVLDHDDRHRARDGGDQPQDVAPFLDREPGEGLVEPQDPGILGERHGDLDAAALAVRGLRDGAIGEMVEPDAREHLAGPGDQRRPPLEPDERIPAQRRQAEQGQRDVSQQRLAREERDDLVGAADAEVRAPATRDPRDVTVEESDRAAVRPKLPGDEVEERRLAGPVGADDQTALAGLDGEIHGGGDAQAAERLLKAAHGQRGHRPPWGGPTWPPTPPSARRAPNESWRSSITRVVKTGPGRAVARLGVDTGCLIARSCRPPRAPASPPAVAAPPTPSARAAPSPAPGPRA